MARRPSDLVNDPVVVRAGEPPTGDMDEWFASLIRDEPTELSVSAAELVAEARAEAE